MLWPNAALSVVLLLVTGTIGPSCVLSEGFVGCLFSDRLCLEDSEVCYDDFAFGRCVSSGGVTDEDDLYQYVLERSVLHDLSQELKRLFAMGYRWSHAYTQCRLQAMLYATRNDFPVDPNTCSHLSDQDLEGALKALEGEDTIDPREVAIIKYTPSAGDPHSSYADEVYFPPISHDNSVSPRDIILPSNAIDIMDMEDPYAQYVMTKRTWIPQMHKRHSEIFTPRYYNTPTTFRSGIESRDLDFLPIIDRTTNDPYQYNEYFQGLQPDEMTDEDDSTLRPELTEADIEELRPIVDFLDRLGIGKQGLKELLMPENYDNLRELLDVFEQQQRSKKSQYDDFRNEPYEEDELGGYYPSDVRSRLGGNALERPEEVPGYQGYMDNIYPETESRVYEEDDQPEVVEYGSGAHTEPAEIFRELKNMRMSYFNSKAPTPASEEIFRELKNLRSNGRFTADDDEAGIYTEGGMVYSKTPEEQEEEEEVEPQAEEEEVITDNLAALLDYDLGFQRAERLDVKKPGPPFDGQIYKAAENSPDHDSIAHKLQDFLKPSMMKKEPRGAHPNPIHEVYDVDTDYAYVGIRTSLETWKQGDEIIRNISALLDLEPNVLTHIRVDRNEVTFRVTPNKQGLNATEISHRIWDIKDKLQAETGAEILETGVGDKVKKPTVIRTRPDILNEFYIVLFTICGILVAMIIAATSLLIIRRHVTRLEKIHGLAPDTEAASKDYQDLCRSRMAAKPTVTSGPASAPGGGDGGNVHGRITSLSRESEQSPSSRSSTSSWSEEPALHNMDISTGHMVLTYMEDHLRNRDRLDEEWVALCAYVAEPSATSIALKTEHNGKNRYGKDGVLPYDHARVVLNDLCNVSGGNYINASSITDHDPRNPAYIATQGPLPQTAPDFWQLIWEQGAVVIVMLSRLTEGGTAMCHRYWPEEGSELYHIYEVHLVSEHIWCDDYLVRSFYLKNARTGETRTVTQFHFLSWPESGVPSSTKALLEFRRKVNKSYRGRSCPIVVHCSDGAGRTGTYCLIDMVLSRMAKGAKEIDIAATLEHLRDQRARMVATKQQFEFVLTAVAEEVHAILKALPPQPPTVAATGTTPPAASSVPEKEK